MPVFLGGVVIFRLAYPAVILNEVKNLFSDPSLSLRMTLRCHSEACLPRRHSKRSEESFFRSFAAAQDDIIVNVTQHDIKVNVARDDNQVLSAHVTVV